MNITNNLEQSAYHFPGNTVVIEGDRIITYAELNRDANRIASAMISLGLRPGEHVGICAPNSYEWLVSYFGTLKAGAVAVTFTHQSAPREIRKILSDSQPRFFFTTEDNLPLFEGREKGEFPEYVVCDNGDISFSALVEMGNATFARIRRDRNDVATILYTGGTTGTPKGAMLTHGNLLSSAFYAAHYERSSRNDRALLYLPLNHSFGQVHVMQSMVLVGGSMVVQNGFNIERALYDIEKYQITNFYGVPTIYNRFLNLQGLKEKLKSIRYCFSAASSLATEVVKEWDVRTGLKIYEAYGMTESAAIVTYNHYYRHVVGSVGTPVNLMEVQIRDENGNEVPYGEKGEICIRGYSIFKGYLNNPKETAAAFLDGDWFRSGDIGIMEENNYLYIIDRIKDLIITGGENVYPREVEEIMYAFPDVSECSVVGVQDKEYGERVTAFVVPKKGRNLDTAELKAYLKKQLSGFKVPKNFITVPSLPKNNTGKILKRDLKNLSNSDS
jgi:long-chain acyl-CoA synthetase